MSRAVCRRAVRAFAPTALGGAAVLASLLALPLVGASRADEPAPAKPAAPASRDETPYGKLLDVSKEMLVSDLLAGFSQRLGNPIFAEASVGEMRMGFLRADEPLTWGAFRCMLEMRDAVILEREAGGAWTTFALERRTLAGSVG